MIHTGERDQKGKLKLINDLKKSGRKFDKILAKRIITLFVCSQCGLRIFFEQKKKEKTAYMGYKYEDYHVFFERQPNFKPFENNYRNTEQHWITYCDYICLECGKFVEDKETGCEKCGKKNIVLGSELGGKPCPVCKTKLDEGITLKGYKTYSEKERELDNKWYNIYRERYGVEKPIPQNFSDEEIAETKRRENLQELVLFDYKYILNKPRNALRFEFEDAFMSGSFYCVLEWDDNTEGKLILFKTFNSVWVEKTIAWQDVEQIIEILNKYDFFNKSFFKDYQGLDGWTFGLEVKIGKKYKELAIWGIERGILYDVGMLLIKFAGKTFKELYEHAW